VDVVIHDAGDHAASAQVNRFGARRARGDCLVIERNNASRRKRNRMRARTR